MPDNPCLIEHAFPMRQASLNSVHEKNVRHGHISTLHIWPAPRTMVACRAETGFSKLSANDWAKACDICQGCCLFSVYNCATPNPRLVHVQDPFGNLLAKAKGSILISQIQIIGAVEV